jgi:hypothetical protein
MTTPRECRGAAPSPPSPFHPASALRLCSRVPAKGLSGARPGLADGQGLVLKHQTRYDCSRGALS